MFKRISLILAVALVVNLFAMVAPANAATVPYVANLTEAEAVSAITAAGLSVGTISYQWHSITPGHVIASFPPGGTTVPPGTSVDLLVSREQLMIPDVSLLAQAEAESILAAAHFPVQIGGYVYDCYTSEGHVHMQDPPGGTWVYQSTTVYLIISLGGRPVPDVVGMAQAAAESAINNPDYPCVGCSIEVGSVSYEHNNTVPEGHVISQSIAAGVKICGIAEVNLTVSSGPDMVVVPDLVGDWSGPVSQNLHLIGLSYGGSTWEHHSTYPFGIIISHDPPAGTLVSPGTSVFLTVSSGPLLFEVPDVVGMNQAAAYSAITSAGLVVGTITDAYSDTVTEGHVISQNPSGGTEVPEGSEVDLTMSLGPPAPDAVAVPDVVGMGEAGAGSAITSAGLYVSYSYEYSDTVPEGHVIDQYPTGGTSVPEGSDVDLTISRGPRQPDDPPVPEPPVPGLPVPVPPVESCLVAHWKLDDGSGNTAVDSSNNGFDITLHNTTWEDGMFGGAVHFQGVGHGNTSNFNCSGNAITVCAWVFHDEFRTYRIERYVTLAGPSVAVIRKEYDGRLHFYLGPEGNFQHLWVDDVLTEGRWHHVAGTWDGLDQRLYIDGVEIAGQRPGGVFSSADSVMISSEDEPFNGMLDDIRIYNCALSVSEIIAVMAGAESAESECLMGYWAFDDRAGVIAYDSIGDYHCTIMDGAGGSPAFERGRYGQAIRFYGDGDHVLNEDFDSLINGLDALTVALWVKSDLTNTDKGFIIFEDPAEHDDRGMRYDALGANGGGVNVIKIGISSDNPNNNGRQQLESSSNVQTNEWQHLAMTWRSGEQLKLYINGILDTPTSNEPGLIGFLAGNTKLIIGKGGKDVADGSWQGLIDDVCIYYCALNENQIESLISGPPSLPSFPSLSSLSNALDTSLSFTTGGNADWFSQRTTSFYGGDAAQSGDIKSDRESWMQTTVSGKGTVSFFWKVSSEHLFDLLEFYIDGSLQDKISGSVDWHQMTYHITGSDLHILEWRYVKDAGTDSGSDCGWVDKVMWMPAP